VPLIESLPGVAAIALLSVCRQAREALLNPPGARDCRLVVNGVPLLRQKQCGPAGNLARAMQWTPHARDRPAKLSESTPESN
jgi:hypothetical protein